MGYKLSRYVSVYEKNGVMALHNSLTQEVVYCEKIVYNMMLLNCNKLIDFNHSILIEAIKKKILIDAEFDEDIALQRIREKIGDIPKFRTMYLILTDRCNLACKYCFVRDETLSDLKEQTMVEQTAFKAIDLFSSCLMEFPNEWESSPSIIVFFGGEPLVNKQVFISAVEYIKKVKDEGKLPQRLAIFLNTNGTILDDEILATIKYNDISVSISIDGCREYHDANRVYGDGRGTFDKVCEGIRTIMKQGTTVSPCCTISRQNCKKIPEIMEWFANEFDCKFTSTNILIHAHAEDTVDEQYINDVANGLIGTYKIFRERGVLEDTMMRCVNPFVNKAIRTKHCDGAGAQLVVAPDGKIGPCQGFVELRKYYTGDVNDLSYVPDEDPTFREWQKRSPVNINECQKCPLIGMCGGGCIYDAYLRTGSIWHVNKFFCQFIQAITEWLVWDLYEKI
jgi:uncharacterized protein